MTSHHHCKMYASADSWLLNQGHELKGMKRATVNEWVSEWMSVKECSVAITEVRNLSNEAEARGEEKWGPWVDDGDSDVCRIMMWSNDWGKLARAYLNPRMRNYMYLLSHPLFEGSGKPMELKSFAVGWLVSAQCREVLNGHLLTSNQNSW